MTPVLFLPGAAGRADFWQPVAARLPPQLPRRLLHWPGLGNEPHDASVNSLDDLVQLVLGELREPADLVAQSMGGAVALRVALAAPRLVRRLVLVATSGGLPVADLGGADWRAGYRAAFPDAATWIAEPVPDLTPQLRHIRAATLLIWGDADPISPVAVGERLHDLLPDASLHVIPGAEHDLAQTHAETVAKLIGRHLG
ncbi:MAG: alpha/beta fold hydrolase [Solimonas sp.]